MSTNKPQRDYYSIAEVAERIGMSVKGVRGLVYRGQLPAVKFGRLVRIPADALDPANLPKVLEGWKA